MQDAVCFHVEEYPVHLESTAPGMETQPYPTNCHGLIQSALEQDETPEHLQYNDDVRKCLKRGEE